MTIKELIKDLSYFDDNVEIVLYLVPNSPEAEDTDEHDKEVEYVGAICTSQLDTDEPFVDLGFKLIK